MSSEAKEGLARVHVFYGGDDFAANKVADELVDRLCVPADRDFAYELIEPSTPTPDADESVSILDRLLGAILTPSFLGGDKTVFLRNGPFFDPLADPGKFVGVKARVDRLTNILRKGLPPGVNLVVVTPKLNKVTSFYKTLAAGADLREFPLVETDKQASARFYPALDAAIAAEGLELDPDVKAAFVDRIGYSIRQAVSELEKLSIYLGDGRRRVTLADLQLMVAPMRESKPWDFADAFCSGSVERTIRTMKRLQFQKVDPIYLIIVLEDRLRDMVLFSDAIAHGWLSVSGNAQWPKLNWSSSLPPEVDQALSSLEKDPRTLNVFRAGHVAYDSRRYSPATWFRWLNEAVETHAAMTGDAFIPPTTSLELFIIRTIGAMTKAGRSAR